MGAPDSTTYEGSVLDLEVLAGLAQRVARETRAPRGTHQEKVTEQHERKVSSGFLGLQTRIETYAVETTQQAPNQYWVLAARRYHKNRPGRGCYETDDFGVYEYCLGAGGDLFIREQWREEMYAEPFRVTEDAPTQRPMTTDDVLLHDFLPRYDRLTFSDPECTVVTDREPSDKLSCSTKGGGLIALLEGLLRRE